MISIDKERSSRTSLKGYTVPSSGLYLEGSGSGDAGRRIWKPVMDKYLKGMPKEKFPTPPADLVRGKTSDRYGSDNRFGQDGRNNEPGGR